MLQTVAIITVLSRISAFVDHKTFSVDVRAALPNTVLEYDLDEDFAARVAEYLTTQISEHLNAQRAETATLTPAQREMRTHTMNCVYRRMVGDCVIYLLTLVNTLRVMQK